MKSAGITYSLSNFTSISELEKALSIANMTNVKMIIACPELYTDTENTVRHFMNNPAVAGYFLRDEPALVDFQNLAILVKKIRAVDDHHFCYINLLPNYATADQLGTPSYLDYVKTFIDVVSNKILSFDAYPVTAGANGFNVYSNWYENLEIFSSEASKANKPFWAFALATANGISPVPTIASLRLQVFSNLAYGAQGIQYFTYWTFPGLAVSQYGPIAQDSSRTEVYYLIKKINQEINRLSGVFMGSKVVSVAHTGEAIPPGTRPLTFLPRPIKILSTTGTGAVVSVLEKGNYDYLVIVNRDVNNAMQLNINMDSSVEKVQKDGSAFYPGTNTNVFNIDPGDIAIYRWLKIYS